MLMSEAEWHGGALQRGDRMSALITAEWYMRKNHFPGWARPFEFNALLYDSIGRHEEARDGVSLLPLCMA